MNIKEDATTQLLSGEVRKAIQLKRDAEKTKQQDDIMYASGYYDGLYNVLQKAMRR